MNRILPEDKPERVNDLLLDKWGISLFKFAQVFAVSPADQFLIETSFPFSHREIKAMRRNLNKMGDDLMKRGRFILKFMERLGASSPEETSDDELIKHMKLESFFDEYIHGHMKALRYYEIISLQGKRGRGINKKSIIALGWGNLISEKGHRIEWKLLSDLYDWLRNRVGSSEFYRELDAPSGLAEDLRRDYCRYHWPGGAANFISEKIGIEASEFVAFIVKFIFQPFFRGREDYFIDKLAVTGTELRMLYMNVIVDKILGSHEGLTLFSKDQSLADGRFLCLHFWLQKKANQDGFPNPRREIMPGLEVSQYAKLPFKTSAIGELFDFAIKVYLDNNLDLRNPKPLIIFPDESYFPTSF